MKDDIVRAAILIGRLLDSNPRNHSHRLRLLSRLAKIITVLTTNEVRASLSEAKDDEARLTWDQVAQCLEISKSAAFARYNVKVKGETSSSRGAN